MEVQDHRDADHPERQGRKDEEVWQGVDLHQAVAAPRVGADEREPGAEEEGQVLGEVDAEPGALVALHAEPVDLDARDRLPAGVGRAAQREHVHRVTRRGERLGLAPHARILLVIGVGEHRDWTACRAARA